ncbi:cytochrome c3 family protein [Pasteurella multocida]|uniref:cytochrome c3 family protein n=1 Tax=Pasteurella multocida TaxID=747 RepID=UPI0020254F93|nr:cytochrome c3 family protein [Pasteurella multocida]URJ86245.1 cytochrome c3 family protein [Pasteurella multocida]
MLNLIKRFWKWFRSPSRIAVGTLITLAFIAGIVSWIGFNYGLEQTNTEEFCVSCHSNDVYPEYLHTAHYLNRSGVKATCPDCHVPHEFIPKMIRKVQASREVYAHLMGYTDTIDKFNSRRLHMAEREWARLKANNSQECRNCHNFENMDFSQQKTVAEKMHALAIKEEKTCIDCHKGIAHQLPDMSGVESGFSTEQK